MMTNLVKHDLHHSVWRTYRHAIVADASWDAAKAFQSALDVVLRLEPDLDAPTACRETARMIMMRPRGVGNHGRVARARVPETRLAAVA
jgi:hypothetical protein